MQTKWKESLHVRSKEWKEKLNRQLICQNCDQQEDGEMERQITVYDRIVKNERVGEIQRKFIQYVRIVFKVWGGGEGKAVNMAKL